MDRACVGGRFARTAPTAMMLGASVIASLRTILSCLLVKIAHVECLNVHNAHGP